MNASGATVSRLLGGSFRCRRPEPVRFRKEALNGFLGLVWLRGGLLSLSYRLDGRRRPLQIRATARQHPEFDDVGLSRTTRVAFDGRANVAVGRETSEQLTWAHHRIDVDQRIAVRFEAELKIERSGEPLQNIGQVGSTRDQVNARGAVAAVDTNLFTEDQRAGEQRRDRHCGEDGCACTRTLAAKRC